MKKVNKLKRAVVREEYVALTGCYKKAIVLNQMIYWSERIRDFKKFIEEENERLEENDEQKINLEAGWIYKKAEELSEETMMKLSKSSMLRILNDLVEAKFLNRRRNPKYKWDKTYQYRVDLIYISDELSKIDYSLNDYKVDIGVSKSNFDISKQNPETNKTEPQSKQNETAIPETTTKTKSENTNNIKAEKSALFNRIQLEIIEIGYKKLTGQKLNWVGRASRYGKEINQIIIAATNQVEKDKDKTENNIFEIIKSRASILYSKIVLGKHNQNWWWEQGFTYSALLSNWNKLIDPNNIQPTNNKAAEVMRQINEKSKAGGYELESIDAEW